MGLWMGLFGNRHITIVQLSTTMLLGHDHLIGQQPAAIDGGRLSHRHIEQARKIVVVGVPHPMRNLRNRQVLLPQQINGLGYADLNSIRNGRHTHRLLKRAHQTPLGHMANLSQMLKIDGLLIMHLQMSEYLGNSQQTL